VTPDPWGLLDELRATHAEVAELRAEVKAMRAAQAEEPLVPLAKILGCTPRAALGRLERDQELRGLGHRLGRRLVFRGSEVRALLAGRQRERSGK
jgi:hypothetical protein